MALLQHTLGMFTHPNHEWKAIREDRTSFRQVFISRVPFLALLPVVAAFFGLTKVGWTVGDGDPVKLTVDSALTLCALTYVALMASIFVFGEYINWMARKFGVPGDDEQRHYGGTALAVYASTPLLIAGMITIYPSLWLNALVMLVAAAYAIFLIYEGLPVVMNIDRGTASVYSTSVFTGGLVLLVSLIIATVIIWIGMGVGPVFVD